MRFLLSDVSTLAEENTSAVGTHSLVISMTVFTVVLCVCLVVGQALGESRWVNESITAILIGCITGALVLASNRGGSSHILRFDEQLFFIYLLPPIIFNAGFQVKKKQFFHNFVSIMLFGVVGVFISVAIISAGCWFLFQKVGFIGLHLEDFLSLGTIFSATDTVCTLQVLHQDETPFLYSLVFGEGVVNDATSVVVFNAVKKLHKSKLGGQKAVNMHTNFLYLFSTSTALGVSAGLLTSYLIKVFYSARHSTNREIALMSLMAYLSYLSAEVLHLSGILTVFFCGIIMSHYAWHNISEHSRTTTRHVFATMSFISETFIFMYVGMDALDIEKWKMSQVSFKTSFAIYCILILLILLGRAAFVFPLSALSNCLSSSVHGSSITLRHQIIIWWAGLMRGAVSVALAFSQFTSSGVTWNPLHATMITGTIVVVLFSTLVFGILTKPLIGFLLPYHQAGTPHSNGSPKEDLILPLLDECATSSTLIQVQSSLSLLIERPAHTIHAYWRRFDDAYMRPVFGGPI